MTDRAAEKSSTASAHVYDFYTWRTSAEGAGRTRTLVTLGKDEMR